MSNPFNNYAVEHDFTGIGRRTMLLNARQIKRGMDEERIILLAIEDITERMKSETILKNSEEQYRRLFETVDDGILLLEKHELKIRHANPAITAKLGYSNEDCIGNNLNDVGFPDDIGNVNEIMQTLKEDGIFFLKDLPIKKKTGQVVDTDIYMVDRASLVQCNIRNITKRKRAEEAIREGNEKLHSIMDNIGVGVAIISQKLEIIELNNDGTVKSSLRFILLKIWQKPKFSSCFFSSDMVWFIK